MKKMLFSKILLLPVIVLLLSYCSKPTGPDVPEQVFQAPHRAHIDGYSFELEANLNRDFMTACPPGGRPMSAFITVQEIQSQPITRTLRVDMIWVINGNEAWHSSLNDYEGNRDSTRIQAFTGGGPKWETGIRVTVVVRLVDEDSNYYLLRASDQLIRRSC
ncbi:MAG: hypothetical protein GY839_08945 [candidate division Zixibacteria bacterium]|nr:hypothetical protein [candidate division Zixibacteria bacterium]